jgi:hypothetical protein
MISHTRPEKKPVIEDLARSGEAQKCGGWREEAFQKSFATEKDQSQVLNSKFDQLLKQAKEDQKLL